MFYFQLFMTGYIYIFYKLQYRGFMIIPPYIDREYDYVPLYYKFDVLFALSIVFYFIYFCFRIYEQTSYDIFFVDWEHFKNVYTQNRQNMDVNFQYIEKAAAYKGAWRGIHVADQFNILQKQRTISLELCFCILMFFWYHEGIDLRGLSKSLAGTEKIEDTRENNFLRFFLSSGIIYIVGIIQFGIQRLLQLWIPLKKTEFLDLCTVSNISVFILDDSLHGYYVHGKSPFGRADTSLNELIKNLTEEEKGKIKKRGLSQEDKDDVQTFEIYISYNMRMIYDGLYKDETKNEIITKGDIDRLGKQSRYNNLFKHLPNIIDGKEVSRLTNYMNSQLLQRIEIVANVRDKYIKDKSFTQRFLDYPPSNDLVGPEAREMIFYRDPRMNFDDVMFTGMEIDWLIMDIYFFQLWSISIEKRDFYGKVPGGSFHLAFILTYLCDRIIFFFRGFFAEKNISRKAIINNIFFS